MGTLQNAREGWLPISLAPADSRLEVCVIDREGVHVLVFPCRKFGIDWLNAISGAFVDIHPTHWRVWRDAAPN